MFGSSYRIGTVWGIPIKVHVTLLLVLPIIALDFSQALGPHSFYLGLLGAIGLFASVVLHELGHSLVALKKGCRAREILLLPIGGIAQMDRLPTNPNDEFQVAIAGPAVSLGLWLLCWSVGDLLLGLGLPRIGRMINLLGYVNMMLLLFNLLPSFPMDGGRIFRAWLTPKTGRLLATSIAAKVGRFMAIVFGLIGLFTFNIFLILIAIFIYQAAGAEYRMVRIQEAQNRAQGGPWVREDWPYDDDVVVSPPPYRSHRASSFFVRPIRAQHDIFDDLFKKWR